MIHSRSVRRLVAVVIALVTAAALGVPTATSRALGQEGEAATVPEGEQQAQPTPAAPPAVATPQAGGGQGQEGEIDLTQEMMSDAEEEALRLVEEILQEQQMLLAGENFVYRAEGRRDPFRNILSLRRRELVAPTERPAGLAGFLVSEVSVTAAALFQGRWHVLLTGLDRRTYTGTVGTELYDGRIVSISMNEVVFEQEVEDLLGARSRRQVVKKINEDQN